MGDVEVQDSSHIQQGVSILSTASQSHKADVEGTQGK